MKIIKGLWRRIKNKYYSYLQPLITPEKIKKVACPFCGWRGREFLPCGYSVSIRKNAKCPKCGSLERHRLYYLYLKKNIPKDKPLIVLHFAPEKIITQLFRSYGNIDYLSADIDPKAAMQKEDICHTSFADDSFDIIFCSHVLEHIPDDGQAMRELRRILKPGGWAILQVPLKDEFNGRKIDKTYEDFSVTDPAEREKVFGQRDHVRIYGRDFKDRLEAAGFTVQIIEFAQSLGENDLKKYALLPQDKTDTETEGWIYLCFK